MSPEIASALRLIYGDQVTARPDILRTLDFEGLKAAFRKRAMELHPDRAKIIGKSSDELSEMFKDVQTAYEQLRELLGPSFDASRQFKKMDKPYMGWTNAPGEHYWEADIPRSKLLLGQFLYYAGLVTFNTLVSAITWQRQQRPTFGKIAGMWDYLSDSQMREIMASRKSGEKLGETAIRLGYLSPFQRTAVIGFQKWLQRPIGEFFQEIGILEETEIVYLIGLMKKHNRKVERMGAFE
jgi:curved DNA-binding protein CbpA